MAIETITYYNPKHALPLYVKITTPGQNQYEVGNEYEIRIADEVRVNKSGERGSYHYTHNAILVGRREDTWDELESLLIAFASNSRDAEEAVERIIPQGTDNRNWGSDIELVVLFFLREDRTEEFIVEGPDVIDPSDNDKSNYEDQSLIDDKAGDTDQ